MKTTGLSRSSFGFTPTKHHPGCGNDSGFSLSTLRRSLAGLVVLLGACVLTAARGEAAGISVMGGDWFETPATNKIEMFGPVLTVAVSGLEPGRFTVEIDAAENYFDAPGKRVMSVRSGEQILAAELDLFKESGKHKAYTLKGEVTHPVNSANTPLQLTLTGLVDNAKFDAIRVKNTAGQVVAETTAADLKTRAQERVILIDYQNVKGPLNTMFKECIGAGRANEGLRADWQKQLAITHQECGFKYIRMHGLLSDDMGVYREDAKGNPEYNYQYVDMLFDSILSLGMKPFVELGFMPAALASGDKTVFWWKANVTPPKDYQKWEDLIRHLTEHFAARYGIDEVKSWYFEVWNEPNLVPIFWTGSQDDYFKLYSHAAKAVKSVNSEYKVGGPATAGASWIPETIKFCEENKVPIDFVSTHAYGVRNGFVDESGTNGTVLDPGKQAVSGDVLNSRNQIKASTKLNLELHFTEWSSSYTPFDPVHDSYHEAAYILEKLKQVGDAPNSMSYWVFTDIFEENGPRFTPFHGGFGLMNMQGIKKAAYYSYAFLNKLGGTELVNTDERSWACKTSKGDVQVLLWDYTYTLPEATNNQQYYTRDLPAKPKGAVKIDLKGVNPGKYQMEVYKIGYRANDAYSTYFAMGCPKQLTKQQVETIQKQNDGSPVARETLTVNGSGIVSRQFNLRENDVLLVRLNKL